MSSLSSSKCLVRITFQPAQQTSNQLAVPLAIAAPALLAGGAWLTAKTQLDYDLYMIGGLARIELNCSRQHSRDRLNIFYLLEEHATSKGSADRIFLMFEGREWSYKQAYDTVIKYGTWLKQKYAIQKGEIVAMDFMNGPTFIFLWFGLWSIGASPAFINYNLTAEPLLHTIKTSTARVLLVDEEIRPQFPQKELDALRFQNIEAVFFDSSIEQEISNTSGIREPDSIRGGVERTDIAILIYTSGTTGLPKAAVVSWQKLWFSPTMSYWLSLKKTDRLYTCMPLYHSSAVILCTLPALHKGATLVLGRRFSTSTFWPEVRQHGATMIQYVGETCRYLLGAKPQIEPDTGANLDKAHNVHLAFGNGVRPDVWERFKTRFGIETIGEFYSSTEGISASWNLSSNTFATGAIGRNGNLLDLVLGRTVAVVDVDWSTEAPSRDPSNHNFCTRVKRGEPGEALYKLDAADIKAKYQGYFNNPDASNKKVMRDVFAKGDAFFRTGDIMRWDSEGRWYFCDRIGDTFRWKSENVSTAEVGEALGIHPRILEANVYGVEVPHHDGRAGCAAVLFSEGEVNQHLLDDVAKHALGKLPRYAVPSFLRVVKEIVATGNNKQQKAGLRKEGVNPGLLGEDKVLWLRGGRYVPFEGKHWQELNSGSVKL